ncbi:MAG: signal peptidase I [Firmicutes bacterium]|nr:signal peptidase I [Bacillota bacterium]
MSRKLRELLSTSIYLLVVLVLTFLVVTYVGQRTQVIGSSMEPMLSDGDNLIVDKISYRFQEPQRFDIIVFPFQYEENTFYIKRIIALPGETIYIDESGQIFIDGEVLKESYGKEVIANPGRAYEPVTLGDDEYFVMGDNRNNSSDSRDPAVGNIHRDELIGKAWVRIWPLNKIGMIRHR